MANCGWAVFRRNIDLAALMVNFDWLNETRFEGCLAVTRYENAICVDTPEHSKFWFEAISKRKLQWKHSPGDINWWLKNYIAHAVAHRYDPKCIIRDEGIDDVMDANFHVEYPTVRSWIDRDWGFPAPLDAARKLINQKLADSLVAGTHPSYWK